MPKETDVPMLVKPDWLLETPKVGANGRVAASFTPNGWNFVMSMAEKAVTSAAAVRASKAAPPVAASKAPAAAAAEESSPAPGAGTGGGLQDPRTAPSELGGTAVTDHLWLAGEATQAEFSRVFDWAVAEGAVRADERVFYGQRFAAAPLDVTRGFEMEIAAKLSAESPDRVVTIDDVKRRPDYPWPAEPELGAWVTPR